jgi:hypothetical protein
LIVKLLPTPFGLEKIEDEAAEDIKGLPVVGETFNVVPLKARWVVFTFKNGFAQHDKGTLTHSQVPG